MNGTPEIKNGQVFDSGKIFVDSSGNNRTVKTATLEVAAFGNAGAVSIAHGQAPDLTAGAYAKVVSIMGTDGTNSIDEQAVTAQIDDTNVVLTSTGDLSGFVGHVQIEFIEVLA